MAVAGTFYDKLVALAVLPSALVGALPSVADQNVTFTPPKENFQLSVDVSDPASQQVTSSEAFTTGAGNYDNSNIYDGTGTVGTDYYNCYYGSWENFPPSSEWIEFDDMFNYAKTAMLEGCGNLGIDEEDTDEQIGEIWNAIQQVAEASYVDHRFILATILQESIGCVYVGTTNNGVNNPGIMQSDNGVSYDPSSSQGSITQMVIDGTQGTASGDGLVQGINIYGNIYEAARFYNSGEVDESDLNDAEGATASYVNDIANRMTGWLYADSRFDQC